MKKIKQYIEQNGNRIKNYKTMCYILKEDVKGGCSKKSQLKDWERYFNYKTEKNKFIIEEVYDVPKLASGNSRNSIYVNIIEFLLTSELLKKDENVC